MMVMIGYIGLIVGFGCLGLYKANQIKKRPRQIREIINALSLLDTEIFWGVTPLPQAFGVLRERTDPPWQQFFRGLELRLTERENALAAWEATINEQKGKTCLLEEDWKIIRSIGKGLGRSDRNEQHKQLELAIKHLTANEEKAGKQADGQSKMWSYLGFLSGMAIVLFIM